MAKILLIEDDVAFSAMLERFLIRKDFEVEQCYTAHDAKQKLKQNTYQLVFTDLRLPDEDGISILIAAKEHQPNIPVILMTGYADVATAVHAMKKGAFDYISKPFNQDEVLVVINNALKQNISSPQKKQTNSTIPSKKLVYGISTAAKKLNEYIKLVAPTTMSVLILGDSGTGKEVIAKRIHEHSDRSEHPFIAVDCGAIPAEIAGSEFFGHIKGSFTGAIQDKVGHFTAANGGTLFLDEVGNLSYENQIQLLRALQERKVKPIGANHEIDVDIRLITATNEDLSKAVETGDFREDLFHRLNEFFIKVPKLSDRTEDLLIFADFFLRKANIELNKEIIGFSNEVLTVFQQYDWPGNIRELANVIKRAVLLSQESLIGLNHLPQQILHPSPLTSVSNGNFSTKTHEKNLIISALAEAKNNKSKAAKLLKITRKTLYNKLKQYEIQA